MPSLNSIDREVRMNQIYTELDRKFEEEETQRKAIKSRIPYINLYGFPVDTGALGIIPVESSKQIGAVVFYKEGRNIKIGVLDNSKAVAGLVKDLKNKSYYVELYLISISSFQRFIEGYKKLITVNDSRDEINLTGHDFDVRKISALSQISERLKKTSTTQLIDFIMTVALELESSDIHLEPEAKEVKLRFRIDGVLQDIGLLPIEALHGLISRIKILSKLKLNIVATPQDGSFSLVYNNSPVDVRVSILPSAFGESIVMRLLRQDKGALHYDDLGIIGKANEQLQKELLKPNGMILTTGPTGSGKTTTLYAILNKLNEPGVKIITLEDPVEYKIPGITQTPIDSAAGLTFAAGLRAVLRQDPDMVMVGEMRDLETAEIACQAALTGHIVLSTLHTNDAASAVPRLLDLGVKPFILAPAVNAIIAQRLVRKICTFCKIEYSLDKSLMSRVEMILKSIPASAKTKLPKDLKFYHSPGCSKCNGLGYKGRMGVYEVLIMTEKVEQLIQKGAGTTEVRRQATDDGMITMAQDGLLKALSGITDVEEVFRVTEE